MKNLILTATILTCSCQLIFSQTGVKDYSEHVNSIDNITETLYSVISGDKGVERDWDLFNYLFKPDAKLMPSRASKEGVVDISYLSPQDYIDRSGPWLIENGFHEKEIYRVTETFGNITHLFSTYAAFKNSKDIEPFMRGINSIQLLYDNERWWIVNIYWQAESDEIHLPEKYLPE